MEAEAEGEGMLLTAGGLAEATSRVPAGGARGSPSPRAAQRPGLTVCPSSIRNPGGERPPGVESNPGGV